MSGKKIIAIILLIAIVGVVAYVGMDLDDDVTNDYMSPGDIVVDTSAEEIVKDYLIALDEGDQAAALEIFHEDGWYEEIEERDIGVYEIEERTAIEAYEDTYTLEELDVDDYDEAVQEWNEVIAPNILNQADADDYAIVYYSIIEEELGELQVYVVVVEVDGEWLLWGPF